MVVPGHTRDHDSDHATAVHGARGIATRVGGTARVLPHGLTAWLSRLDVVGLTVVFGFRRLLALRL